MTTERCVFEGIFGEVHIPDLLTFLDMLGKTGTLELCRDGVTKRLYWASGEIVFADSEDPHECLEGYLARNGWISEEGLADAREKAGDGKESARIGHLIKSGELEAERLPKAVRSLVFDIVYSLFEWDHGNFRFVITESPHHETVVLRTSVSNIIMEGSRRLDEWVRFHETFPRFDIYFAPEPDEPDVAVKLAPIEEEVLGHVDGKRTLMDLVRATKHDLFTTLGALHALLSAGLIRKTDAPPVAAEEAGGNGLSEGEASAVSVIVGAFNNIFAGIHERIVSVKGATGQEAFAATLQGKGFQNGGVFVGLTFEADGRLPEATLIKNVAALPEDQRLPKLKGNMDRLLAKAIVQMDRSYAVEDKKAISDLISREKDRIAS